MATVRVTHYGMDGSGRNVTEAKRDAGRKIEAALSGHYTPEVAARKGWAALVFREPGRIWWQGSRGETQEGRIMQYQNQKIRFSDGREGRQYTAHLEDGTVRLCGVVVNKLPDGTRCEHVYSPRGCLNDGAYALADLGNVTWEVVG
jgi:hypothetical protein